MRRTLRTCSPAPKRRPKWQGKPDIERQAALRGAGAPNHWRHFYAALAPMLIGVLWKGVTDRRGIHVGAWIIFEAAIIIFIALVAWFEHGKPPSMHPSYVGMVFLGVATAISNLIEKAACLL